MMKANLNRKTIFGAVSLIVISQFFLTTETLGQTTAGNALQFDGSNDFAFVADNASLDITGAVTLETWVQLSSREPVRDQLAVGKRYAYYIYSEASAYGGSGNWKGSAWAPGHTDTFGTTNLAAGQWYHLAMTFDGETMKVFVNGQKENELSNVSSISTSDYNLSFGMEQSNGEYALDGFLDEVRLWDIARSEQQIAADYNKILDPTTAGLVGYWNFDEEDGQTIYDITGNGNNGLLGATDAIGLDDPTRVVSTAPVPEPATMSLLAIGSIALIRKRK